ncbi:helix-turn-helix domain-containing protein [Bradyrhizobium valentinum]|uniref:helix-turn-helix domain-containing protein n=1 Tax=Bradyrhizobium valentinum TaxID=1518501 RepID=UPI0009E9744E
MLRERYGPECRPRLKNRRRGRGTHQSLERGSQVLETIAATGSLVSLGEAARRTGLHRSTNA